MQNDANSVKRAINEAMDQNREKLQSRIEIIKKQIEIAEQALKDGDYDVSFSLELAAQEASEAFYIMAGYTKLAEYYGKIIDFTKKINEKAQDEK